MSPRTNGKSSPTESGDRAHPITHQKGREIQAYGKITRLPIALDEKVCARSVENLNQILADTITLRDLYKKHHWQVAGHTFYQLHLLFDKHYEEQNELVDAPLPSASRCSGGISLAMAARRGGTTIIPRPPRGREEVPVQISRLLEAHEFILKEARDHGQASQRLGGRWHQRPARQRHHSDNELQAWFVAEHVVDAPLVRSDDAPKSESVKAAKA